jgi:hypothetical protein
MMVMKPLCLQDMVIESMEMISMLVQPEVELKLKLSPDLPDVLADAPRLQQILTNLLGNAAKFTSKGCITLSAEVQDQYVLVRTNVHKRQPDEGGVGVTPQQSARRASAHTHTPTMRLLLNAPSEQGAHSGETQTLEVRGRVRHPGCFIHQIRLTSERVGV